MPQENSKLRSQNSFPWGISKSLWRPPALGAPSDRSEAAPHLASHRPPWWDCWPTRSLPRSDASHRHGRRRKGRDVAGTPTRRCVTSREVRAGRAGLEALGPSPSPGKRGLPRRGGLAAAGLVGLVRERGEKQTAVSDFPVSQRVCFPAGGFGESRGRLVSCE